MKKTRFIRYMFAAACMLLAAGCSKEQDDIPVPSSIETAGGKAVFTFTPDFGNEPGTRALTKFPEVKNIYFAVFDAAGYKLSEYAEAVPNSYATTNWDKDNPSKSDVYSYSVELTITDKPRIVHIIANAPESLSYGTEDEVIGSLFTSLDAPETAMKNDGVTPKGTDCKDAYWCRLYLEDGVWAEPDIAQKDTDPQYGYKLSKFKSVVDKLNKAKLVRNFTQITTTNYSTDNFLLTGFWLTNVPDLGSVAPYNRNTGTFVINYGDYNSVDNLRGTGSGQGNYQGFFPANAGLVSIAGTDGWQDSPVPATSALGMTKTVVGASVADQKSGASTFCYEREVPKSNPLYVIVAGKFKTETDITNNRSWDDITETYYKIDLKDENDIYFPILRNFDYRINISAVRRAGAATVEGALSAAPSGDISTSLDMLDLTNISDGISQIFVSETEAVLVGNENVILRYKYIPDLSVKSGGVSEVINAPSEALTDSQLAEVMAWTSNTTATKIIDLWDILSKSQRMTLWAILDPIVRTHVDAVLTTDDPSWKGTGADQFPYLKKYVTISRSSGETGSVFKTQADGGISVASSDASDGYREITLKPMNPSAVVKTETVTIIGHCWVLDDGVYKESTMSRVVTYRLREKLTMTVSCSPVKIPNAIGTDIDVVIGLESGLPSSIFSLDMDIEANALSITANNTVADSDLPVSSGVSTINEKNKPAYWFTRTITWSEYQSAPIVDGKKYFTAHFRTNKLVDNDQIYVSNKYFNQANTKYTTYEAKLFQNLTFKNGTTTVTEANVGTALDFTYKLNELPAEVGGKRLVEVAMYGVEPATGSGLTYKESRDGYEVYEMNVSALTNTISVKPYTNGKAYIRLSADSFITEESSITVKNSTDTKFTIEANSLNIYRVNTDNLFDENSIVSIYFTDPSTSVVKPVQTFTINGSNRNPDFTLYSTAGSTIYLSVENTDGVYYAQATIDQLNSATTGSRRNVIFTPAQPVLLLIDYVNGANSATGWVDLPTADQTGKGFPVNGQAYNLLGYVTLDNLSGVQIYGKAAARTGLTKVVDGRTYYQYKTSSTTTTSTSQIINNVQLAFNGSNVAREVRVWQAGSYYLDTNESDRLTTTDAIVGAPYGVAMVNVGRGRYLTATNSLGNASSWDNTENSSTWIKFNSVSGGYTMQSLNSNSYYLRLNGSNCSMTNNSSNISTLTLTHIDSNHSWTIYNSRYLNMGGASTYTIQRSSSNDDSGASRWYIYAIKKHAATDPMVTP